MPITKELTIRMENHPGSLARLSRTLANHGINIVAFQSIPSQKSILVCIVADNPAAAQSVLDHEGIIYTEAEVVQVKLPNRPGELARVASRLGEANININYAYFGVESGTDAPLVILGITEVSRAVALLDSVAAAASAS